MRRMTGRCWLANRCWKVLMLVLAVSLLLPAGLLAQKPGSGSKKDCPGKDERQEHRQLRRQELKSKHDTDGDGTLSEEERTSLKADLKEKRQERLRQKIENFDTDGDGKLS